MKKQKNSRSEAQIDAIFCVNGEMLENNGEDSYAFSAAGSRGMVAAFDGCGGIGARRYENFSGKTGAYVASRAVSGAVSRWFDSGEPDEALYSYVCRALSVCDQHADRSTSRMMGSLGKSFPTTAAVTVFNVTDSCVDAAVMWAGDSRCYCLDAGGLHQLSVDDVAGEDALSNLRDDGVLTNVISSSVGFDIHRAYYRVDTPCIIFSASDGCFGYINTPMQFEYVLVRSIVESESIDALKLRLDELFRDCSSDDYTLCTAIIGFGSFEAVRAYFVRRLEYLEQRYIYPLENGQTAMEKLWYDYSAGYYCYLPKEPPAGPDGI